MSRSRWSVAACALGIVCVLWSPGAFADTHFKALEAHLDVAPGGMVNVRQTFRFPKKSDPPPFEAWVARTARSGPLYHDMGMGRLLVEGGRGLPVDVDRALTPNGERLTVEEPRRFFDNGPELNLTYPLASAFQGDSIEMSFFGSDGHRGKADSVVLEVVWSGTRASFLGSDIRLETPRGVTEMVRESFEDGRAVFRSKGNVQLPVTLRIASLRFSGDLTGSGSGASLVASLFGENLWFSLPFLFIASLFLLGWMLRREGGGEREHYNPTPRPPSGMEPGTAAAKLYGGVSSRLIAASALWFAHRGKVTLELRSDISDPLAGMMVSKRSDPDASFKDYERILWNGVLFEGVDSNSLSRIRQDMRSVRRAGRIRSQIHSYFPVLSPLKRAEAREWWLWSTPYKAAGIGLAVLLVCILFGPFQLPVLGDLFPVHFAKPEWLLSWPLMAAAFYVYMDTVNWQRSKPASSDRPLMEFVTFLQRDVRTSRDLHGNVAAFSLLLPFAVAVGSERALIDAYCEGENIVPLPHWLVVYGVGSDAVHVHVLKELVGDLVEGMLRAF